MSGEPSAGMVEQVMVTQTLNTGAQNTVTVGSFRAGINAVEYGARPFDMRLPRVVTASRAGFQEKKIYGFVTNPRGTKVLKRFALGTGGTCGYVKRKVDIAPGGRSGNFRLYVNAGTRLDRRNAVSKTFGAFGNA